MERQGYLDGIKAMGALMIVSLHTMSSTMNAGGFYISDAYSKGAWILHQFLFAAVPMFIMATGAGFLADGCLLGYREMKGHIGKIVCCICFFGSAFYMIRMLVEGEAFGAASLVRAVLEDYTWSHMWYLYRLLGLYLCMPLLSAFMWGGGAGIDLRLPGFC